MRITTKKALAMFASTLCIAVTFMLFCTGLEIVLVDAIEQQSEETTTYTDGLLVEVPPDSILGQQHQDAVSKHDYLMDQIDADNNTDGAIQTWFKNCHVLVKVLVGLIGFCLSCVSVIYLKGQWSLFLREMRRTTCKPQLKRAHR